MSQNQLPPDDPRLTAYALGELDPTEQAAFEQLLAESPDAQSALREIRELAGLLTSELRQEPVPELTIAQRTTILDAGIAAPSPAKPAQQSGRTAGRWTALFATLAAMAALIAVAAILPAPGNKSGDQAGSAYYLNDDLQRFPASPEFASNRQRQLMELRLYQREANADGLVDMDSIVQESEVAETVNIVQGGAGSVAGAGGGGGGLVPPTTSLGDSVTGQGVDSYSLGRPAEPGDAKSRGLQRFKNRKPVAAPTSGMAGGGLPAISASNDSKPAISAQPVGAPAAMGNRPNQGSGLGGGGGASDRLYSSSGSGKPDAGRGHKSAEGIDLAESDRPIRGIRPERLSKEVGRTIDAAKKDASRDVNASLGALKRTLKAVELSTDLDGEIRERLRVKVQGTIDELKETKQKVGSKQITDLERVSAAQARGRATNESKPVAEDAPEPADAAALGFSFARPEGFRRLSLDLGTEAYDPITENPFLTPYEDPLSTFGVDVDTASYANVRRFLTNRQLPPPNAVRIEELINYFAYDYPQPAENQPFSVNVESGSCPWNTEHRLVRIGLKGREIPRDKRPVSNLVFLVDVSGSMQPENKLPLVKMGLNLLTRQMTESDRVAIVTYSDTAALRLDSTNGAHKQPILNVIESLQANGSTNGAAGIQLAYRAAIDHFIEGGTNRVILCTDGDFNVGVTGDDELVKLIQERARTKVFFSVFGFGMGNLKDGKLEKLADKGNGHYAYIDNQNEAHKMFVEELSGTLVTIAKDVKVQVEFNPAQVGAYRLIGYENRMMASQDFANDKKDAGDIGAGHTVTALYEVFPAGLITRPTDADTLRYRKTALPEGDLARELLTVKLRYKLPEADASTLVQVPITDAGAAEEAQKTKPAGSSPARSREFNWAAAVAAFGMILRDSQFRGQASFDMVLELAQGAKGEDPAGRRQEFIELVKAAKALVVETAAPGTPELPIRLTREQAEANASMNGKYKNLLRIVEAEGDRASYGAFYDYGHWEGTSYREQNNLPQGYWVYVYPNWYIWGDN